LTGWIVWKYSTGTDCGRLRKTGNPPDTPDLPDRSIFLLYCFSLWYINPQYHESDLSYAAFAYVPANDGATKETGCHTDR
jgi:hypothetical protein